MTLSGVVAGGRSAQRRSILLPYCSKDSRLNVKVQRRKGAKLVSARSASSGMTPVLCVEKAINALRFLFIIALFLADCTYTKLVKNRRRRADAQQIRNKMVAMAS